jgi:hypothetical protein
VWGLMGEATEAVWHEREHPRLVALELLWPPLLGSSLSEMGRRGVAPAGGYATRA